VSLTGFAGYASLAGTWRWSVMYGSDEAWCDWTTCQWYGHDFSPERVVGKRYCVDCGEEEVT
jgi:hypothetical protein